MLNKVINTSIDSAPEETTIYFSKGKNMIGIIFNIVLLIIGIFLLTRGTTYIVLALFLLLMGFLFGKKFYQDKTDNDPQIIISNKGLETSSTQFYNWSDIKNEEVIKEVEHSRDASYKYYYLSYEHPAGTEKFALSALETNYDVVTKLLVLYRERYQQNLAS